MATQFISFVHQALQGQVISPSSFFLLLTCLFSLISAKSIKRVKIECHFHQHRTRFASLALPLINSIHFDSNYHLNSNFQHSSLNLLTHRHHHFFDHPYLHFCHSISFKSHHHLQHALQNFHLNYPTSFNHLHCRLSTHDHALPCSHQISHLHLNFRHQLDHHPVAQFSLDSPQCRQNPSHLSFPCQDLPPFKHLLYHHHFYLLLLQHVRAY